MDPWFGITWMQSNEQYRDQYTDYPEPQFPTHYLAICIGRNIGLGSIFLFLSRIFADLGKRAWIFQSKSHRGIYAFSGCLSSFVTGCWAFDRQRVWTHSICRWGSFGQRDVMFALAGRRDLAVLCNLVRDRDCHVRVTL